MFSLPIEVVWGMYSKALALESAWGMMFRNRRILLGVAFWDPSGVPGFRAPIDSRLHLLGEGSSKVLELLGVSERRPRF